MKCSETDGLRLASLAHGHPYYTQKLCFFLIALARALASEETTSVFAADFMARHDLGSTGGIQGALKKLTRLDIIERLLDGQWKVTDPVFKRWLIHQAR